MRAMLFVSAMMVLVASCVLFFAGLLVRQYNWAFQVCNYTDLCDRWAWLAIAAAMAGFVAFVIRAMEI